MVRGWDGENLEHLGRKVKGIKSEQSGSLQNLFSSIIRNHFMTTQKYMPNQRMPYHAHPTWGALWSTIPSWKMEARRRLQAEGRSSKGRRGSILDTRTLCLHPRLDTAVLGPSVHQSTLLPPLIIGPVYSSGNPYLPHTLFTPIPPFTAPYRSDRPGEH